MTLDCDPMPQNLELKYRLLVVSIVLVFWLIQYFLVNKIASSSHGGFNSRIRVDASIPVIPEFIVVYFSTYVLVILPPILVTDTAYFIKVTIAYVAITLISSSFHLAYPSRIERLSPPKKHGGISWHLIGMFQGLCKPYGNFPSTHMAFSVLSVFITFMVIGYIAGIVFSLWAALIAVSTLVTRQHYLLDLAAGCIIGAGVAFFVFQIL